MRSRFITLFGLFLLTATVVIQFILPQSAHALRLYDWLDGSGDITEPYTLEATAGGYECTPTYNAIDDTIDSCTPVNGSGSIIALTIPALPANTIVNKIALTFDWKATRYSASDPVAEVIITANGNNELADWGKFVLDEDSDYLEWEGAPLELTELYIYAYSRNNAIGDSAYMRITSIHIDTTDIELIHPIYAPERHDWNDYTADSPHTVVSFSDEAGRSAYSVASGVVLKVERLNWGDCSDILNASVLAIPAPLDEVLEGIAMCGLSVPSSSHGGSSGNHIYTLGGSWRNILGLVNQDRFTSVDFYLVEVYNAELDVTFQYFVDDAPDYVVEGATITAGCIIGKTIAIRGINTEPSISSSGVSLPFTSFLAEQGVVIVKALNLDSQTPLINLLTLNPVPSNACNVAGSYSDCLGDGELSRPADWISQGGVGWNEPGVTLGINASIRTTMNLDPDRYPRLRVGARSYTGTGSMRLRIGLTTESFDVPRGQTVDYAISGDTHQPDSGIFYTIMVENIGNTILDLDYVCVSFTRDDNGNDDIDDPLPHCLFTDYSFSEGGVDWVALSTVEVHEGELRAPPLQPIYQDATLPPGDYTISVTTALWHYSDYILDETDTTATVTMSYRFPGLGASPQTIDTATMADYASGLNQYKFTTTFTLVSETSGEFRISHTFTDMPSDVRGVAIREVCVSRVGGSGDGNEPFPELDENCEAIEKPSGAQLSDWTPWLWHNFNQFFDCHLMVLLNQMFKLGNQIFRFVGWQGRYWQATFHLFMNWLSQEALPWLGGYLANASGSVYVTNYGGEGGESCEWWNVLCHLSNAVDVGGEIFGGLFDLLETFLSDILSPITDFIITIGEFILGIIGQVITLILDLLFLVFVEILKIFNLARDTLFGIIDSYNNAPAQSLPFMPNCANGEDNMICWMIFTAEQTLFSGTAGGLIIPLFTSLVAILMTIQFAGRIKKMLQEAGSSL